MIDGFWDIGQWKQWLVECEDGLCHQTPHLQRWFTADIVPPDKRQEMRELCDQCPVFEQCKAAAEQIDNRATAGFWAGKSYNTWGGTGD